MSSTQDGVARESRLVAAVPLRLALGMVAAVWLAGCVWSFREQTDLAAHFGFEAPALLPLVLDGLAVGLAAVAYAAALDGRAAASARLGTGLMVAASAASNATWAWLRTDGDPVPVTVGAAIPLAANLAFEVLLGEHRRLTERRRGSQVHPPLPTLHPARWRYAPLRAFCETRRLVLALTAPATALDLAPDADSCAAGPGSPEPAHRAGPTHTMTRTAQLRTLLASEVAPDDTRPVAELARELAPRVGLRESTARRVITDQRHTDGAPSVVRLVAGQGADR